MDMNKRCSKHVKMYLLMNTHVFKVHVYVHVYVLVHVDVQSHVHIHVLCTYSFHVHNHFHSHVHVVVPEHVRFHILPVLDTKSQNIPEVVVVRRGGGGVPGTWEGRVNWVGGSKWGQFTSNLRGSWTIPVTSGGSQVSGRGHKGEIKGS